MYVYGCVYGCAYACRHVHVGTYVCACVCIGQCYKSGRVLNHNNVLICLDDIMVLYACVCARVCVCTDMYGCICLCICTDWHVCILTLKIDFSIFMFSLSQRCFKFFEWYHAVVCLCMCTCVCVWWYVWMCVSTNRHVCILVWLFPFASLF